IAGKIIAAGHSAVEIGGTGVRDTNDSAHGHSRGEMKPRIEADHFYLRRRWKSGGKRQDQHPDRKQNRRTQNSDHTTSLTRRERYLYCATASSQEALIRLKERANLPN